MGLMCAYGKPTKEYIQVTAESTDMGGNPVWTFTKSITKNGITTPLESKDYIYSSVGNKKTIYELYQLQHVNPYFNLYAKVPLICMYKTSENGTLKTETFEAGEQIIHRLDSEYFYCVAIKKENAGSLL